MAPPKVVMPDAEAGILDYLRAQMPGLQCGTKLPASYEASSGVFLAITRIGGSTRYPVMDHPRLDIEVYGPTRAAAHDVIAEALAELAIARYRAPVSVVLYGFDLEIAPQYVPDPVSGEPRWQATMSIGLRAKRS